MEIADDDGNYHAAEDQQDKDPSSNHPDDQVNIDTWAGRDAQPFCQHYNNVPSKGNLENRIYKQSQLHVLNSMQDLQTERESERGKCVRQKL